MHFSHRFNGKYMDFPCHYGCETSQRQRQRAPTAEKEIDNEKKHTSERQVECVMCCFSLTKSISFVCLKVAYSPRRNSLLRASQSQRAHILSATLYIIYIYIYAMHKHIRHPPSQMTIEFCTRCLIRRYARRIAIKHKYIFRSAVWQHSNQRFL